MSLSVGVIGVGRWGRNHVRVLSSLKDLVDRLVIVDADAERAKNTANMFEADTYYVSLEDFLKNEKELDAAVVAVPTVYHFKVASRILEYTNVMVEKPLAATLEEGYSLLEKAEKQGRKLAVGHIERFNPIVEATYSLVKGKDILSIDAKRLGPGPATNYTLNLGVAHDLLVHDIDVSNMFMENLPTGVFSYKFQKEDFPYEVEIAAFYSYPDGKFASLIASWRTAPSYKHRSLTIRTEDKVLRVDYILRRIIVDKGIEQIPRDGLETSVFSENSYIEISYLQEEPLKAELRNFLEAVKNNKKPKVDGLIGYVALKCIVKALEASEKGQIVKIDWNDVQRFL